MLPATLATAGTKAMVGRGAGAQDEPRLWHRTVPTVVYASPSCTYRGKKSAVLKNILDELVKILNFIQP